MERLQRKEEQKVTGGMNPVQMAKVMGNQAAIVQRMPEVTAWTYSDVCTPHFIRRHLIDGCEGTMFSVEFMNQLQGAFLDANRPMQIIFRRYIFCTSEYLNTNKINHMENGR